MSTAQRGGRWVSEHAVMAVAVVVLPGLAEGVDELIYGRTSNILT